MQENSFISTVMITPYKFIDVHLNTFDGLPGLTAYKLNVLILIVEISEHRYYQSVGISNNE